MKSTFVCQHCGKTVPRDPRIKKQKYCSLPGCQNARKRSFDRKTSPTNKSKILKKVRNKRWRDARPAHVYQKVYREYHPDYVKRNRQCKYRVKIAQVHRLKTAQLSDVKLSFLLKYANSVLPGKEG